MVLSFGAGVTQAQDPVYDLIGTLGRISHSGILASASELSDLFSRKMDLREEWSKLAASFGGDSQKLKQALQDIISQRGKREFNLDGKKVEIEIDRSERYAAGLLLVAFGGDFKLRESDISDDKNLNPALLSSHLYEFLGLKVRNVPVARHPAVDGAMRVLELLYAAGEIEIDQSVQTKDIPDPDFFRYGTQGGGGAIRITPPTSQPFYTNPSGLLIYNVFEANFNPTTDMPNVYGAEEIRLFKKAFDELKSVSNEPDKVTAIYRQYLYNPANPADPNTVFGLLQKPENKSHLLGWDQACSKSGASGSTEKFFQALLSGSATTASLNPDQLINPDSPFYNAKIIAKSFNLTDPEARLRMNNYYINSGRVDIEGDLLKDQTGLLRIRAGFEKSTAHLSIGQFTSAKLDKLGGDIEAMYYYVPAGMFFTLGGLYEKTNTVLTYFDEEFVASRQTNAAISAGIGKTLPLYILSDVNNFLLSHEIKGRYLIQKTKSTSGQELDRQYGWEALLAVRMQYNTGKIRPYGTVNFEYANNVPGKGQSITLGGGVQVKDMGGLVEGLNANIGFEQQFSKFEPQRTFYLGISLNPFSGFSATGTASRRSFER